MDPLLIGVLVFLTLMASGLAVLTRAPERQAVAARLQTIERERMPRAMTLALPFSTRALIPLLKSVVQSLTHLLPPRSIGAVRTHLERAGRRSADPVVWILTKWALTAAAGGGAYALTSWQLWPGSSRISFAIGLAGLAYLWPELKIRRAIQARQTRILKELPETLDLLTISVEAGLGLDQALGLVASRRSGPLSEEIRGYLDEVALGAERPAALKAIGARTGVEELVSFTAALVQAMEFGVSIAHVLRVQADEVRVRRRQRIEERAMKTPVKMLFPLIFLILPALFVVAAGPGLIRLYTEFIRPSGPTQFTPPVVR